MLKKAISLVLTAILVLTVIPVMSVFASAASQDESTDEKMLHVVYENIDMSADVLMLQVDSLSAGVKYTVSFDYNFASGMLDRAVRFVLCGYDGGSGKRGNVIRASSGNNVTAFDTVSDNGANATYTFTLSQSEMISSEMSSYEYFYLGFGLNASPRMITDFYIANFKAYQYNDSTQSSIFVKDNCDDMAGWTTNWRVAAAGVERIDSTLVASYDFSAQYEPYNADLFLAEEDIIHFGDSNFDNSFDIKDLVNSKYRAINKSYVSSVDLNEDGKLDNTDLASFPQGLIGREEVVFEEGESHISAASSLSGGADLEAAALKLQTESQSNTLSGTIYVAANGSYSSSGSSESNPTTIARLEDSDFTDSATVLFKRGDTFRISETLPVRNKVSILKTANFSYGAYGTGAKPVISGSLRDYADKSIWSTTDGYVWKTTINVADVGNIVFNDGAYYGFKKATLAEVDDDGDFYFDSANSTLYLYLRQVNPGIYFNSIEIPSTQILFGSSDASGQKIENLSIRYAAKHGINVYDPTNFTINGCDFEWIGGVYDNGGVRLGNAIQFWDSANNCTVTNNYIYQVYDAAITFQGNSSRTYSDLTITNNLIECTSMNFEFWDNSDATMTDIDFSNNILRFSGYGFGGIQRDTYLNQAYILAWARTYDAGKISNFNIQNNIFDVAKSNYFYAQNVIGSLNFSNNTYYQNAKNPYRTINTYEGPFAKGLQSFKDAIITVEPNANVYWVGPDYDNGYHITASYYVKNGGTGDGRTVGTPAATVASVIDSINEDLAAGDIANVYIMQREDWNDSSSFNFTYWDEFLNIGSEPNADAALIHEHDAKMVVQPYDSSTTTYLALSNTTLTGAAGIQNMLIGGPTEFKNVALLSSAGNSNAIVANGNDVTLGEGVLFKKFKDGTTWGSGTLQAPVNLGPLQIVFTRARFEGTYNESQNIVIENDQYNTGTGSDKANRAIYPFGKAATNQKFKKDVTLIVNNSGYNVNPAIYWGCNSSANSKAATVNGNVNVNIKSANSITNTQNAGAVNIDGGLQYIIKSGITATGDVSTFSNVTATRGKWFITDVTAESDMLGFTETAGEFAVKEGYTVVATKIGSNKKYYSDDGILTIPAGSYTIGEYAEPKNYYVKNGETGTGLSPESPMGKVVDVLNAIKDLPASETVNIYIMQRDDYTGVTGDNLNVTYWDTYSSSNYSTTFPHSAKVIVQPYNTSGTTYLAVSSSKTKGQSQQMNISGPTEFRNITLLSNVRTNTNTTSNGIVANGYSVTIGENVAFKMFSNSTNTWNGATENCHSFHIVSSILRKDGNYDDQTISINSSYISGAKNTTNENKALYLFGKAGYDQTFSKDLNLVVNHSAARPNIYWGCNTAGKTATVEGNVNITVKNASTTENHMLNYDHEGTVTINGGLQWLVKSGITVDNMKSVPDYSDVTINGGVWYLTDNSGINDIITFTETKGTYYVRDGYKAIATNASTNEVIESADGILQLAAGEYTITATKDTYLTENYYVKNGASGDGRSIYTPAGTVASVISSINADLVEGDTANVYIMQRSDWDDPDEFNIAAWDTYVALNSETIHTHAAKIVVQAYKYKADSQTFLALSSSNSTSSYQNMKLGGPTEFKNITLLSNGGSEGYNCVIIANGYDLTFSAGTKFAKFGASTWDGTYTNISALQVVFSQFRSDGSNPKAQTVVIAGDLYASGTSDNRSLYPFGKTNNNITYASDLNLVVDKTSTDSDIRPKIYWGSNYSGRATAIDGNVNINIKNADSVINTKNNGDVTIAGGLQYIVNSGVTVTGDVSQFSNVTAGGKWFITDDTGVDNIIEFTDVAGTYNVNNVPAGYALVATNGTDEVPAANGKLTIPAGNWTLTLVELVL